MFTGLQSIHDGKLKTRQCLQQSPKRNFSRIELQNNNNNYIEYYFKINTFCFPGMMSKRHRNSLCLEYLRLAK